MTFVVKEGTSNSQETPAKLKQSGRSRAKSLVEACENAKLTSDLCEVWKGYRVVNGKGLFFEELKVGCRLFTMYDCWPRLRT